VVDPSNQPGLAWSNPASGPVVASAISTDAIIALVEAGLRAPSGDNCQPWRFRWDRQCLRVVFVPERADSFYDVQHVASWISLGALLTNMRTVARPLGWELRVDLFPRGDSQDAVAKIRFEPSEAVPDPLVAAIGTRCVNRRPYRREPLPDEVRGELQEVASLPGVRISWVESRPLMRRVAAMAAQNDRLLFEVRALHDGLYRWLRWGKPEAARSRDGMPIETLELGRFEQLGFRLLGFWPYARLLTMLGGTRLLPIRTQSVYERSGAIALLSVAGQERRDFVRGGEILERIWLTATLRNVSFQPITGITLLLRRLVTGGEGLSARHRQILARLKVELDRVFELPVGEAPIMLFRLGLAPPPSARAPRLPPEDTLSIDS
jgi:hypothetical protein